MISSDGISKSILTFLKILFLDNYSGLEQGIAFTSYLLGETENYPFKK